ncbi:oxytocin receptor [Petromyzon marinus]|uniref:Vasotocin V1 hormone receptor 3 n=1 Tax=Petromyzon marinus TaxID=7757 RepID=A0A088DHW5_PETMA|nr:vasotocin V1 hormone receptor 3 [Petromyzon marinus]
MDLAPWRNASRTPRHHNVSHAAPNAADRPEDAAAAAAAARDERLAAAEIALLAAIVAVAIAGNGSVLLALSRTRRKASRMNLFVKHLSVADLAVAAFQVLPQLSWDVTFRFRGPDALCRLVKYLQVVGMFASTYVLIAMTVDRYLAICHPLSTLRRRGEPRKQAHAMVACAWALSALLSTPQVVIFSLREVEEGVFDCWADFGQPWGMRAYVTWITVSVYVAPVLILAACYGAILLEICRNLRLKTRGRYPKDPRGSQSQSPVCSRVSSVRCISRAKVRTIKMTLVIIVVYVVCWTPFFVIQMWAAWDETAPDDDSSDPTYTIVMLLSSLNSCTNPWIYMSFSGHLLEEVMSCCRQARCATACRRQQRRRRRCRTPTRRGAGSPNTEHVVVYALSPAPTQCRSSPATAAGGTATPPETRRSAAPLWSPALP